MESKSIVEFLKLNIQKRFVCFDYNFFRLVTMYFFKEEIDYIIFISRVLNVLGILFIKLEYVIDCLQEFNVLVECKD